MTFVSCVLWISRLAAVAACVNAVELLWLARPESRALAEGGIWRQRSLQAEWGVLRPLLATQAFVALMALQIVAALLLFASGDALYAGVLTVTTLLAAVRFRGNVNGGSDAMLFTVLAGLTVAQLAPASALVREGAVLYIAAQLTLSYLRAGIVKARQLSWWNGSALTAFVAFPAYGVPAWASRDRGFVRVIGIIVVIFECVSPAAWFSSTAAAAFIVVAIAFHFGTALLFGLNRFLLAWCAAMPALWYAVHRV